MYLIEVGSWNKKGGSWYDYSITRIVSHSALKKRYIPIDRFLYGLERFMESQIVNRDKNTQIKVKTVWEIKLPFTVRKMPILHLQAMN